MQNLSLDTTKDELLLELQRKGIHDPAVLSAIASVPRERFVHPAFARKAYNDVALPIGLDQTISQPFTVAYMTQSMQLQPGMKVLEIGTGSGYQAAILAAMKCMVYSVERHEGLSERARSILAQIAPSVHCRVGDGSLGWPEESPFDRIIVTAGAPTVPEPLLQQLRIGGMLVIPVGDDKRQRIATITRNAIRGFNQELSPFEFSFVPLRGEQGWDQQRADWNS